jgi:glyoxalase-like protein
MAPQPTIDELVIADEPEAWAAAGFRVDGDTIEVGTIRLHLAGRGDRRGIASWSIRDATTTDLDGLDTSLSDRPPAAGAPHPNGTTAIDHVVVLSPDLDRTVAALEGAGLDYRRLREGPTPGGSTRQAFFRMGETILEVVGAPDGTKIAADPSGPARLWGISFLAPDLDATAAALGPLLGEPREAVQPGRRIATVRREAGLGPAIAFMSPGPGAV